MRWSSGESAFDVGFVTIGFAKLDLDRHAFFTRQS